MLPCFLEGPLRQTGLRLERAAYLLGVDVDLVVLDSMGLTMKMQVLKTGILLHAEKGAYEQFFVSKINEYDDLKYCRR